MKLIKTAVYRAWLQKWISVPYVFRRHQPGDVTSTSFQLVVFCCAVSSQTRNGSSRYEYLLVYFIDSKVNCFEMMQENSFNLTAFDLFYVEQSSTGLSPQRYNTLDILNSTELSGALAIEHTTLSSAASLEPRLLAIDSDSNEPNFFVGMEDKTQSSHLAWRT